MPQKVDFIGFHEFKIAQPNYFMTPNGGGTAFEYDTCDVCGNHRADPSHIAPVQPTKPLLPSDAAERKRIPLASGVLDYFPSALIEVAKVSYIGNEQHNPGEKLHWSRGKSKDQDDTITRHFLERGTIDPVDGQRHSAKLAWRCLALLQLELEAEGAPLARGAKLPEGEHN